MADSLSGIGVSPGVAAGPVAQMAAPPVVPTDATPSGDPEAENQAAMAAMKAVATNLEERAARAPGEAASVLAAQAMMAEDPTLASKVTDGVNAGKAAITAVVDAFEDFRAMLAAAGPYMAERVADLDDLRNRTVATLLGVPMPGVPDPGHPFVLVALDLAPADTATLDADRVKAIITEEGGPTSHTAILAKSLGIPAVVTCHGATAIAEGETVLVDGTEGSGAVAPDEATGAEALDAEQRKLAALKAVSGPGRTSDGHPVQLLVNIAGDKDLEPAAAADSEGVGLFRTELLFLDRPNAPPLEEQQAVYQRVFAAFPGRKVVVRTLDAGADKPLEFVTVPDEPNPALGVRGLRTSRRHPELLEEQLTAVAAAAAGSQAQVWVMAPMVSTTGEAAAFAEQVRGHGLSSGGVMVEVPAAAIRARHVAAACDFMSIGTNDLSQYTYAADRMAGELADLLDPWQPALLDLVRMTAEAGKALGKPVGVCGEAASDPLLALVFVG
ncbi:MAG TPA: putative PEP-binding protein, partial [Actinomycetota bacterium]|nr:putative PEP-binding protein [Actinomycetota bacterium]